MFGYRHGLVALGLCAVTSIASAALTDGVVSVWDFNDGTANDRYNRNNGKLVGGAKIVDGGKMGKGVDLNGKDALVSIPHGASMDALKDGYTIAAWVFIRTGKDHSAVAFKGEKVGWGPLFLFRMATTSNTNFTWGAAAAGREAWFATDNVIAPNKWIHFAQTADGTVVTAYIDGKLPKPTGGDGAFNNPNPTKGPYLTFPNKPVELGVGRAVGGTVGNDAYLDGIVDEAVLYKRALSTAEVGQLGALDWATAVEPKDKVATTWGDLKRR